MNRAIIKITSCLLCLLCAALASNKTFAQADHDAQKDRSQKDQDQKRQADDHGLHQYAPLREFELEVKDFAFTTLDDSKINLREAARGKKLVLVHYFAAWCHNSNFDVQTMTEMYDKYREQGLLVIGVCEYSSRSELRKFIEKNKPTYPICIENDGKKKDRTGTTHYAYRNKINDDRLWGTPLNILIADRDIQPEGEIIAGRVRIATGEAVKTELEEMIRRHLQLN